MPSTISMITMRATRTINRSNNSIKTIAIINSKELGDLSKWGPTGSINNLSSEETGQIPVTEPWRRGDNLGIVDIERIALVRRARYGSSDISG